MEMAVAVGITACFAVLRHAVRCAALRMARIEHCPFMETKTFCSACKVHCYQPEMREKIRTVMRWAGPRMLPVHPVLTIKHVIVTMKARREANAGK